MHELLLYGPIALPALAVILLLGIMLRTSRNTLLLGARLDAFEKSLERTQRLLHDPGTRIIAEGVVAAVKEVGLEIPVVVRLQGTNVEKGRELLANSGLAITPADDLNDAARKAVAAVS